MRRTNVIASLGLLVLFATAMGCNSSADPVDSAEGDPEAFCTTYAALDVEQPQSYVGSAEHVRDMEDLLAIAPEEIHDDLVTYRDYLQADVDPTDDESVMFDNWPEDVRDAIERTQAHVERLC